MWADFSEDIRETDPTILCIHGVICGAMIYYACSDLIAREFQASDDINQHDERPEGKKAMQQRCISLIKLLFVVLGSAVMLFFFTLGGPDLTTPHTEVNQELDIKLSSEGDRRL